MMSDDLRLHPEDDAVTRALRELHAPPGGDGYWSGLEVRIMARIASAETAWWSELGRWARPALAAAAALVLAAGLLLFRSREAERQVAYEDVLSAPTPISVAGAARPSSLRGLEQREETLQFLITY